MTDAEVRAVIGRLLVTESAQAAGLLVASPAGAAGEGVLLVASQQSRGDGTLACALVRIRVLGDGDADESGSLAPAEPGGRLVGLNWEAVVSSDEERVYLVSNTDEVSGRDWRDSGLRATPQRWASIFQVASGSSSD